MVKYKNRAANKFQNVNPERGRKRPSCHATTAILGISEREPRKGTETKQLSDYLQDHQDISEREPRKGTETFYDLLFTF